jgi:3,4-dihydroxy-2-butanone 4-phosphate synthase
MTETQRTDETGRVAGESPFSTIEEGIEEIREGRMVVVCDGEDRENEGDLVMAAQFATPEAVNFMAKEARGLICLALTAQRCERLGLNLMAAKNEAPLQTAFTVTIEAAGGVSTGISAHDRAHTIQVAIDPESGPRDIVVPGHMVPLRAKEGGVLERTGHTEASVDLDVDPGAGRLAAERGGGDRVRDQRDVDRLAIDPVHGQADAVERDRALVDGVARHRVRQREREADVAALVVPRADDADAVDVALDEVTTEAIADADGALEAHAGADAELAEGRPRQGLGAGDRVEARRAGERHGQAHAVDRDRLADRELARVDRLGPDPQDEAVATALEGDHDPDVLDQASEHGRVCSMPPRGHVGRARAPAPRGRAGFSEPWPGAGIAA